MRISRSAFRKLFPTLAEWPVEKWMILPVVIGLLIGIAAAIEDSIYIGTGYSLFDQ